ncbi:protoporphyrinogen oxidase [Acidithrix ferrooxidans]|uniref:Coproporphyrinogen III oxidase n=1 Tax=Acidithrix ferrooxidans TaxID=1280514 RepID=A0A0D8HLN9_9ACTN|nr:protoporphyrinogen oxidase [Acidithrix ferrooxidans]KJF18011.1 protoporphyrinogen oxidase [Acidithrix ferrooxidans]
MNYLVVGAGITGIAASIELISLGVDPTKITLIEAQDRCGGKIRSKMIAGISIDVGPDSFLTRSQAGIDLAKKLNILDQVVRPSTFSATIFAKGRLHDVPSGIMLGVPVDIRAFLGSASMLSLKGRLRAGLDFVLPKTKIGDDATISHLIRARFGHEVDELLVDPMVGGINAGSTKYLGLASVAPAFLKSYNSQSGRSLAKSLIKIAPPKPSADGTKSEIPFASFGGGLETLVQGGVAHLLKEGATIMTSTQAIALASDGIKFHVRTKSTAIATENDSEIAQELSADALILALPAPQATTLLGGVSQAVAELIGRIDYSQVGIVLLAYKKGSFKAPLKGSGVLVPKINNRLITAITFASRKWSHLDNSGLEILKVSIGRHRDTRFESMSDEDLTRAVSQEVGEVLGATVAPIESVVFRWKDALAQYRPFHSQLVASAREELSKVGAIEICGAAYDGVGLPSCIESGQKAAQRLHATVGANDL